MSASAVATRRLDPERLGDHVDRLYRAARALCGSPHDAEDLVQETFVRVLRQTRFLQGEEDVGYLLTVLRNTFYSEQRARAARPSAPADPDDLELRRSETAPDPHAALEAGEVLDAVAGLPDPYRDAIVAVDVAGLSYREAACALGTPEGTIMSRLYRARRRMADELRIAAG